jgi:hypothetical protein
MDVAIYFIFLPCRNPFARHTYGTIVACPMTGVDPKVCILLNDVRPGDLDARTEDEGVRRTTKVEHPKLGHLSRLRRPVCTEQLAGGHLYHPYTYEAHQTDRLIPPG